MNLRPVYFCRDFEDNGVPSKYYISRDSADSAVRNKEK